MKTSSLACVLRYACWELLPNPATHVQVDGAAWEDILPCARGWFAATSLPHGLLVHGGTAVDNSRLADMHLMKFPDAHPVHRAGEQHWRWHQLQ